MARNIFYILIIFYYFKHIYCVDYQYDRPNSKPADVSVQFPKYNIKIAPTIVKRPLPILYQETEIPSSSEEYQNQETIPDYNNENHEPNIFYVESEPIRVMDYNTDHNTQNNYNNEYLQPNQQEYHTDYNNEHIQPLSYYQDILNNYNNGHLKPIIYHEMHTDYNNDHEIQNTQPYYHGFNQQFYVQEQPKHQPSYGHSSVHTIPQNTQPYHDSNQQFYVQEQPKHQPSYGHSSVHTIPQTPIQFNHFEHNNPSNLYTNMQQSPHQPIITREPIPHKINPEYLRNSENFDENVGISRKHKDWFYTAPNWNQNAANDMNILRAADPRGIIASHTSFVKFKKPNHGHNVFFTNHKKFINTNRGYGGKNIHKNTHVLVHNRDANENDNNNDIIGSHLFAGPRWRREATNVDHSRTKRGLLDFARLVVDPKTKLDIEKTSENVGAATRNAFEEDYSPVFHLTNALGSAQDSFQSLMND